VEEKYMKHVNDGDLQYDENQYHIILQFMKVQEACKLPKLKHEDIVVPKKSEAASFFGSLWDTVRGGDSPSPPAPVKEEQQEEEQEEVGLGGKRGIYLYGDVGTG
jgi:predicted ATPase